ncbi:uncharacterized protein LOC135342623 [Halichondria panicea]|uniref:uncharacterized protein LOC135342623 n=1 Tax=Halichondria panicea TaxID=6063 RepID=UPI00312BBE34
MVTGLSQRLTRLDNTGPSTEESQSSPPALPIVSGTSWADRPNDSSEMNYQDESYRYNGYWDEPEPPAALMEVSENTAALLKTAFGKAISNQERQSLRKPFPAPRVDHTKCPKLDRVLKGNISKETKDRDNMLAKAQTLFLDAVAPLSNLLESVNTGNLTPEVSANAVKTALGLLGNALANLSKERRKLVVKDLNKDASSLAEDDEILTEAAPMLFGEGFEQKLKNHVEAVRCLRKSSTNSGGSSSQFFSREPSPRELPTWGRPEQKVSKLQRRQKIPTLPEGEPVPELPTPKDPNLVRDSVKTICINARIKNQVLQKNLLSQMLNMGVSDMAIELAACKHPPAGKLRHATKNWRAITQDSWVLGAVTGFKIPFVGQPYQTQPPTTSAQTMADQAVMAAEIQSMIEKQNTSKWKVFMW